MRNQGNQGIRPPIREICYHKTDFLKIFCLRPESTSTVGIYAFRLPIFAKLLAFGQNNFYCRKLCFQITDFRKSSGLPEFTSTVESVPSTEHEKKIVEKIREF